MPILVECPGCGAKLNAPDSGAGKKVRCPKPHCGELIPVPAPVTAEEVEVVEAEVAPPPRRRERDEEDDRRRRRRDEDEEDRPRGRRRDDDDEEDRPRRRRRREDDDEESERRPPRRRRDDEDEADRPRRSRYQPRKKRGMGTGAVIAILLGSLVVLGGIGYGVYAMLGGSKTPIPPGWNEYTYADDGFRAAFPKEPKVDRMGGFPGPMGGKERGGFPDLGGLGGAGGGMTSYTSGDFNEAVHIEVTVIHFPAGMPSLFRDQMTSGIENMPGVPRGMGIETRSVKWMGEKAVEVVTSRDVTRIAMTDKAMYQASIGGKNGKRATREEEKAFFDNFVPAR